MSLASSIDDRTVGQQLRDLGVVEVSKITVEGVRWLRPRSSHPRSGLVTIGTMVYLPAFVTDDLGEKIIFGTGKYQGRAVLLIKAAENEKGYKHGGTKGSLKRMINAPKMLERLKSAGVGRGLYEPVKVRGGWVCERVEL